MHRLGTGAVLAVLAALAALAAAAWWASARAPAAQAVAPDQLPGMAAALVQAASPEFPGLAANVRGVEPFPLAEMTDPVRNTVRRGKYNRVTGVVYVSLTTAAGKPLHRDVVAGVIAHELAHAATVGEHGDAWREAYVKMLRIATDRLGWTVRLECSSCPFYSVCERDQCPLCSWKTACRPAAVTGSG